MKGDVLHALKSNENEFKGFKEAYFSQQLILIKSKDGKDI